MRRLPLALLAAGIALLTAGLTIAADPAIAQIRLGNGSPLRLDPGDDGVATAIDERPPMNGATFEDGMVAFLEEDFARISAIWQPLAIAGDVDAQRGLGIVYRDGVGTAANPAAAARWFRRAATAGDGQSQVYLAQILSVDRATAEAADWARRAAEQGIAQGQFMLGQMYQSGEGVPIDPLRAAIWYERAAGAGLPDAQLELGLMFRDGLGIQANPARAEAWLSAAAAQGRRPPPGNRAPIRLRQRPAVVADTGERSSVAANTVDALIQVEPLGPLPLADENKLSDEGGDGSVGVVDRVSVSPADLAGVAADVDGPGGNPAKSSPESVDDVGRGAAAGADDAEAMAALDLALQRGVKKPRSAGQRAVEDGVDSVADDADQVAPAALDSETAGERLVARRRELDRGREIDRIARPVDPDEAAGRTGEPTPRVRSPGGSPSNSRITTRAVPRIPPVASRQRPEQVVETTNDQTTALDAAAATAVSEFTIGLSAFGVGDYDTARALWEPLAARGDERHRAQAHLGLGWLDEGAGGGRADFAAAAIEYEAAANLGSPEGFYRLALLYADGRGVDLDPRRAERLRRQAIDAALDREPSGLTAATGALLDVRPDTSNWLTRSLGKFSRKESALSKAYLLSLQGMDQDAVALWQALAANDVAAAQFALARAADTGRGLPADPAAAMNWLLQAADSGYGPAMYNLGIRLSEGRGIDADPQRAAMWFERAADSGVAEAQHMLGLAYVTGTGVEVNLRRARRLLADALAGGVAEARLGLAAVYLRGERENTDPLVSLGHLETAARNGSGVAQAALGLLLARGVVIEPNMPLALAWLERAGQGGNLDAQYNLGVLGAYGRAEDLEAGYQWLDRAANGGLERAKDLRDVVQDRVPRAVVEQAEQNATAVGSSSL